MSKPPEHQRFADRERLRFRQVKHGKSCTGGNALTIGTNSRGKVMILGVVGLVAASLLYIDLCPEPLTVPGNTQVAQATRPQERIDRPLPDVRLRIDLLAALRAVEVAANARNLFQFAATEVKNEVNQTRPETKIVPIPPPPFYMSPGVQSPTQIPLRFYGYTSMLKQWPKRAFFLEGDAIYIAAEGELIERRYRVIYVGVNSAVVEDTSNKNRQTLPLVESL